MRRTSRYSAVLGGALALLAAGCGEADRRPRTGERPPAAVVVSASIDDAAVKVSPRRLGAGPITLVISNQSAASQQVTLETAGRGPGETAIRTGPINPSETASVEADVQEGTYALSVAGDDVRPARLVVGARRASAQNDLLQP